MTKDTIPADIEEFILQHIHSVAQIEALLLLRSDPETAWDSEAVERRLYIDRKKAEDLLDGLAQGGFLATTGLSYRYKPHTQEIERMVERVADFYARYLVPVTDLIHSKSKDRVQEFADAFRIRKD
jgi:hypothetical protein